MAGARIAVIAVHGVADQPPFETARSVAALLQSVERNAPRGAPGAAYSSFVESSLHVPVGPVSLLRRAAPEGETAARPSRRGFREALRGGLYSSYGAKRINREAETRGAHAALDYGFMANQLERYTGKNDPASYATVSLSGARSPGTRPVRDARIDIYEMYWADLSRLGKGLLRILGEFYQLLFHVSSLGKTTVDMARLALGDKGALPALGFFQAASSWLLVLPIAILNLHLALLAAGLALVNVPEQYKQVAVAAVGGILLAVIAARIVFERWRIGFRPWSLWQAAGLAVGAAAAYLVVTRGADASYRLLTLLWIVIAVFAVDAVAAPYALRRTGADAVARIAGVGIAATAGMFLFEAPESPDGVVFLIGRTTDLVFMTLVALWTLLVASHLVAWILGRVVVAQTPAPAGGANFLDPGAQLERAVWTGMMGLFIPAALFLILTLSLWLAALPTIGDALAGYAYRPLFAYLGDEMRNVPEFIDDLVHTSAGPSFNLFFGFSAVALVMVIWGFFPAVLAEVAPPGSPLSPQSRRIGRWLDHGFRLARGAGRLALFATFVLLPVGTLLANLHVELPALLRGDSVLKLIGALLAGSALGLVALGSQLGKVFLGFRSGLDVALDVDNWLRERPLDANVRARICARYVSLLRQVCAFRDENGNGYDAIVIVAHSQGTVITADLLRFLARTPDPRLRDLGERLPVYLFTLGCPLRQLYGRRFPHLYAWATHDGGASPGGAAASAGVLYGTLPRDQRPEPGELRAELWVNAFASGDYVGRHLWLRDDFADRWEPAMVNGAFVANDSPSASATPQDVSRVELCLGAGAHTHYFDATSSRVAQILDQLIEVAIVGKRHYALAFPML